MHKLSVCIVLLFTAGSVFALNLPDAPNCPIFPDSNVWNKDVTNLPVHRNSALLIRSIGSTDGLHPDFGSNLSYGIPFNVVSGNTPKVRVSFYYPDESDAGPYPIPQNPKREAGSDHHILIVDRDACKLYEIYDADRANGRWEAGAGAIWNLRSNLLRPNGWTSADAAGLPILPGLIRFDEVNRGLIDHALRFTASSTRDSHIYPARHHAGESNDAALPPMGMRVRLKASVNISGFSPRNRVILTALKRYGMILADNGSSWFITGVSDKRWNAEDLNQLKRIKGNMFEVVDTSSLRNGN
ncbi:hypothetical protein L0152_20525 [bacterium]|nr:hypothetical protein [bacterium]